MNTIRRVAEEKAAVQPVANGQAVEWLQIKDIRWIQELYPRLKPNDALVERYRAAIDLLPPVVVARGGALVDGYHRWQAHLREGRETIAAIDLGNLTDAEFRRESITRNASHGEQLSQADKRELANALWLEFVAFPSAERQREIAKLLSVVVQTVREWTQDARSAEKEAQKKKVWSLHLDGHTQQDIADAIAVSRERISDWLGNFASSREITEPPGQTDMDPKNKKEYWGTVQTGNVWNFPQVEKDAGQQSYFGALAPQVIENLLWFYTNPGDTVVDPFAGSGTAIEVAKQMGRRVWASDINGNRYSPHLPIHKHNILTGWPRNAPILWEDQDVWEAEYQRLQRDIHELEDKVKALKPGQDAKSDEYDKAGDELQRIKKEAATRQIAIVGAPAPNKAHFILLDPPYWQQAKGKYSDSPDDLGNMSLEAFYDSWKSIVRTCVAHLHDGGRLAFIISPTELKGENRVVHHARRMANIVEEVTGREEEDHIIALWSAHTQAKGQDVDWARENKRMLKMYRNLVIFRV